MRAELLKTLLLSKNHTLSDAKEALHEYVTAYCSGDIQGVRATLDTIGKHPNKDQRDFRLLEGNARSVIGRWEGDKKEAERGLKILLELHESNPNDTHIRSRLGNAYTRLGYLTQGKVKRNNEEPFLTEGIRHNRECRTALLPDRDSADYDSAVADLTVTEKRVIASILRDLADGFFGRIRWHAETEHDGQCIDALLEAENLLVGEEDALHDLLATRASLALACALQAGCMRRKTSNTHRSYKFSREQLIKWAERRIRSTWNAVEGKQDFSWARTTSNLGFAASQLFRTLKPETRSDQPSMRYEWTTLAETAFNAALDIYRKHRHVYRYAIIQEGLVTLYLRREASLGLDHVGPDLKKSYVIFRECQPVFEARHDFRAKSFRAKLIGVLSNQIKKCKELEQWYERKYGIRMGRKNIQNRFESAAQDPSAYDFEDLAPEPRQATNSDIRKLEQLLELVRRRQNLGQPYDPPEGRKEFVKKLNKVLRAQGLCIQFDQEKWARSLYLNRDSVQMSVGRSGTRSLNGVEGPIRLIPVPPRRRPARASGPAVA